MGLSVERLSASIQSSLFQSWVCSASSMRVKTFGHRTAPSASSQPPCRRIFVKCLEMLTNSQSLLVGVFSWDYFPMSVTESNWCKLWLWRSFLPYWWMSTCHLFSLSSAAHWLLWWRGSRNLVVSLCWNKLSCLLFDSSWFSHPRLLISWLSWRYLYFYIQSSSRFWILQFRSLARSWRDR